jgi:type IV pilus assembly protein PilV
MRVANIFNAKFAQPSLSKRQLGAGLIEVLVSIVIMSFGMLGLAGMYNYSLSANKNASSRMTAAMLVTDYAEIVRANPNGFSANLYDVAFSNFDPTNAGVSAISSSALCSYPNCNIASLANQDIALMGARTRAYLPAGTFVAQRVGGNQLDIWILWVEGKGGGGADDKETAIDNCPPALIAQSPRPDPFPRCLYNRVGI